MNSSQETEITFSCKIIQLEILPVDMHDSMLRPLIHKNEFCYSCIWVVKPGSLPLRDKNIEILTDVHTKMALISSTSPRNI